MFICIDLKWKKREIIESSARVKKTAKFIILKNWISVNIVFCAKESIATNDHPDWMFSYASHISEAINIRIPFKQQ